MGREGRAPTLFSVAPRGSWTMKQSFASAARVRGGGSILTNGSITMFRLGSPPPRIVSGQPGRTDPAGRAETVCLRSLSCEPYQAACRSRTPLRDFARVDCAHGPLMVPRRAAHRASPGTLPVPSECPVLLDELLAEAVWS